jgi:hypothetical protein
MLVCAANDLHGAMDRMCEDVFSYGTWSALRWAARSSSGFSARWYIPSPGLCLTAPV